MKTYLITGLTMVILGFVILSGSARLCRPDLIPNGTKNSCANCHVTPGGALNPFGAEVEAIVVPGSCDPFWGRDLAVQDADGDDVTNGMELQDPAGVWQPGYPAPGMLSLVTNPGDDTSFATESVTPQTGMNLVLQKVAEGFTAPTVLTHAGDGSGRLFVADQTGEIYIIKDDTLLPAPFLDVSGKMVTISPSYDERGLLGLAFHYDYATNGLFYVYYSAPTSEPGMNHKSLLVEYQVSTDADIADPASERIILEVQQPESNHNAGQLAFGQDNFLYVGLGDGGGGGDQHGTIGNGQDITTLLGSILRLDVDTGTTAGIPADNPFVGTEGRDEIYAYGLRNPWKFSFDRDTGKLFCADVGQNMYEEVDIIEKGGNYGWRIMEGYHCYDPPSGCDQTGLELPITEYDHTIGVSVSGGYVYRGSRYPALQGKYVFGDWSLPGFGGNGRLMYLEEEAPDQWRLYEFVTNGGTDSGFDTFVRGFGEDEDGDLYVLSNTNSGPSGDTGLVHRMIIPAAHYTFESGAEGWEFEGEIPPYDVPTTRSQDGHIRLNPQRSTFCFSYLISPGVDVVDQQLYRARWYVGSTATNADQALECRLRVNQQESFQAWNRIVTSKTIFYFTHYIWQI